MTSCSSASTSATARRNAPQGLWRPRSRWSSAIATSRGSEVVMSSARRIAARTCSSSAPSRRPKTTRIITSSVTACIRGCVAAAAPAPRSRPRRRRSRRSARGGRACDRRGRAAASGGAGAGARRRRARGSSAARRTARGRSSSLRRGPDLGVGGEHAPDVGRVGDQHHRRVGPRHAQRERLAVAGLAAPQERRRPRHPLVGLDGERRLGTGRQHRLNLLRGRPAFRQRELLVAHREHERLAGARRHRQRDGPRRASGSRRWRR